MILDSGERTVYSSGAVRDMKKGKGRCDLLPLEVVAKLEGDSIIDDIHRYQQTGDTDHLYAMLGMQSVIMFHTMEGMLLEVAVHMEEGAAKYGERNWEQGDGIPEWSYIDSAVRHYLKWKRGDDDERHDRAFCWNIICLIATAERKKSHDS